MKKNLFFILLSIYTVLLVSKKTGYYLPEIINSYLSDLICLPIVLSICLYSIRWIKNNRLITFSISQISVVTFLFAMVFEVAMPIRNPAIFTSDFVDVILYGVGGLAFYFLQTTSEKRTSI